MPGIGGSTDAAAGRADRGGMTGHARREAGAAVGVAAADVDVEWPVFGRDAFVPDDHAGSRVATDTSRGDIAAVVAPGRALGNRRTTGPGIADDEGPAAALAGPAPVPATVAAAAAPGATVRIALAEAGLTVAVDRSSRLLPTARNNAGPRVAAAIGSSAEPARARPPIDARASPAMGAYDAAPRARAGAAGTTDFVAVVALLGAGRDDGATAAGRVTAAGVVDPVDRDGAAVSAASAAIGGAAAAAAAGMRRTTAGSAALVARVADDIAAIDGAAGNDRRDVAAVMLRAGPVTRRNPAGPSARYGALIAGDAATSVADINGSTPPRLRAAVSPGAGDPDGELATLATSSL